MCDVCQGTAVSCLLLILRKCPRPDPVLPSTKRIYVALSTCTTTPAEERSLNCWNRLPFVTHISRRLSPRAASGRDSIQMNVNFLNNTRRQLGSSYRKHVFSIVVFCPVFLFLDIHPTHGRLHAYVQRASNVLNEHGVLPASALFRPRLETGASVVWKYRSSGGSLALVMGCFEEY